MSETHHLVVDRFEGDLAVVEVDGERFVDLPRWLLPPGAREDDVIVVRRTPGENAVSLELEVDAAATAAARAEARRVIHELRKKDPGGDISL